MKKAEELNQRIAQLESVIEDLKSSELVVGIAIKKNTKTISFHNTGSYCDFSEITKILQDKVIADIEALRAQVPDAQKEDDLYEERLNKMRETIETLIDKGKIVQAKIKLETKLTEFPELWVMLESINHVLELTQKQQ